MGRRREGKRGKARKGELKVRCKPLWICSPGKTDFDNACMRQ